MNEQRQPNSAAAEPSAADLQALAEQLRGLPELSPPPHIWQRVQERADAARSRRRRVAPLALAAGLFAAGVAAVLLLLQQRIEAPPAVAQAPAPDVQRMPEPDFAALLAQSRAIEARRRQTPALFAPSDVERVLRASIGGIDASLTQRFLDGADAPARRALLQERVQLMRSLEHVERYRQRELVHRVVF